MRVLVMTVVHDPEDARIRHRQIPALIDAGHRVTYAAPFTAFGRTRPQQVAEGVDLPRASGRRRLAAIRAARRTLRQRGADFDLVLLHDIDLLLALPRRVRSGGRPTVVWDVHEDTAAAIGMRDWLPTVLRPLGRALARRAERWAEQRLRLILAESAYAARFRRQHPVVPNSVAGPAKEPSPPGTDRVVYLGRITVARGARELVKLGERLAPRGIALDLIGPADAAVTAELTAAARSGAVRWHGFVPNDEARAMLDGAMAGLSLLHDEPNYAHSRPTKIMEYLSHGLPVITTPNPSAKELVLGADAGFVVPFGDVAAVIDAIDRLRADEQLRRRLSAAGRAAAVEFDWAKDAREFVDVLAAWAQQD